MKYETIKAEIVLFNNEDVITTSSPACNHQQGWHNNNGNGNGTGNFKPNPHDEFDGQD